MTLPSDRSEAGGQEAAAGLARPSREQLRRARAIIEYVRLGPFDLAGQVRRLTDVAELAMALVLAQRDQEKTQ